MSGAQARMAEALLRGCGAEMAVLRMPVAAVPGDDGEQLGLATPLFEDVVLGPVVWRRQRDGAAGELVVSATSVEGIVGSLGYDSVAVLFREAAGVVLGGQLLVLAAVTAVEAKGDVAAYRVKVVGAVGVVV